ncbi:TetR/AcrR family transcriptional regulator [Streptomyces iconiensis]|uniref:TetR/AcrR family transcriptional regulator n=1 Tax=Streptomyces iconiensis TaxID=1384038 RepID=A0ABT7A9T2_9ACTN|nr:TetR/AcrR family transcriptional regulator [Streptomyces iconiensis]MDJ1138123.1 TetR/AcrR family transcriptional regulator [Streptomyces iconiensis]
MVTPKHAPARNPKEAPAQKKTATGTDRRAELLATAAEVFAELGYNATTVRKIADRAGMLAGSLYYHFDSKESMADDILSAFLTDLWEGYQRIEEAELSPRATFEGLVTESFRQMERHRPAVVIYQKEARRLSAEPRFAYLAASQQRFQKLWTRTLERGVEDGSFRAGLDIPVAYRFVRDSVWVAAIWYRPEGRKNAAEIAEQYTAMVLDGLAAQDGSGQQSRPARKPAKHGTPKPSKHG